MQGTVSELVQRQRQQQVGYQLTSSKRWVGGRAKLTSFMSGSQIHSLQQLASRWQGCGSDGGDWGTEPVGVDFQDSHAV